MSDLERIYSVLLHSDGLKIREISKKLELDRYYVAEILFSPQNSEYWYQDDNSLWYAKEGVLQIKDSKEKDELTAPVEIFQKFNIAKFLHENNSVSLNTYLWQIKKFRLYSNDEILELFRRHRNGDRKAFELIVKSQQRLVVNIAFLYSNKGVPLEDVIQEGNIGLIKAVERFDYTTYRSFSNFAKSWILQSISNSMMTIPFFVRLPLNQLMLYRRVRKLTNRFEQQNGYPPSVNDIVIDNEDDLKKIAILMELPENLMELVDTYDDLDNIGSNENSISRYEDIEYNSLFIRKLLNRLNDRESLILRLFYGIDAVEETLSSIGAKLNLTRERARQILWSSVHKLQDEINVKREDAQIGEMIRIDSTGQVGRVINIKQGMDGLILVIKTDARTVEEVPVYDTPYHIVRKSAKKRQLDYQESQKKENPMKHIVAKKDQKAVVKTNWVVPKLEELKAGDNIRYDKRCCIVKKIVRSGKNSKLFVEYTNGVQDLVPYNKSRYVKYEPSNKPKQEVFHSKTLKNTILSEALVGDKIQYGTRQCIVMEKRYIEGSSRLIVKYDDGNIDNVANDWKRYKILERDNNH